MTELPLIRVEATATFKRNVRALAKKYRSIRKDIQPVIEYAGSLVGVVRSQFGSPLYSDRL
jgi:hypothetical protein